MKLTTKITLTFILVIAVAQVTASLLIGRSAGDVYRGYLSGYVRREMPELAVGASTLHARTGSWEEVQTWLDQEGATSLRPGRRGQGPSWQRESTRFLLVDTISGRPLVETDLPKPEGPDLENGVSVLIEGVPAAVIVAYNTQTGLGQAEQTLLDQVNRAILFSAVAAAILALILGGLLIAGILYPLRKLEAGVQQIAKGDFRARTTVAGRDEIAQLGTSFNLMAASLQKQEELRERLVADIAHELRTPLSVIQGSLQAILDGVYPLELGEIETIYEETRLLSRLISDLHELAQAEAGQLSLARQPVEVNDVLSRMADSFRSLAAQEDVALSINASREKLMVQADPDRLHQILHNLVGNAVRHTPAGGLVELGANSVPDNAIRFWVRNNGPAIDPEDLPHVFSRFYRADASRMDNGEHTTGAGLGLTIAKALVEAHGGRVGVESHVGEDTTFWFELPKDADALYLASESRQKFLYSCHQR